MDIFGVGSGSSRKFWNFTNEEKEGFSPTITGDVVEIAAVPRRVFQSQEIDRWKDGNPKTDMRITLLCADGVERCFSFKFSSSRNTEYWNNLQTALFDAMKNAGLGGATLQELAGLNITVATKVPPAGFGYSMANPRPFTANINGRGTAPFRGCIDEVSQYRPDQSKDTATSGMMSADVASRPVASGLGAAQQQAAAALGITFEEVPSVYDADIPF